MAETAPDDLDKPLGKKPEAKGRRRFVLPWSKIVSGIVVALVIGLGIALLLAKNPLGGEPFATASIDISAPRPPNTGPIVTEQKLSAPEGPKGPTISIIDGMSGKAKEVEIAPPERATGLDPRIGEKSKHGLLPSIATDGTRPLDAYGIGYRPKTAAEAARPRVGIVIGGLGISVVGTGEAINRLPAQISLAFAPYGNDLESMAQKARAGGHEIYLQVPMEPFDYPDNDSGPQSLLTTLAADRNLDRLQWSMARFTGYAGIMNYMGAKFTASENALTPVMRDIAKRGLLYIDDGSSARSTADHIAEMSKAPFLKADLMLDRIQTPAELDAQLTKLEQMAKEKGSAVGIGSAFPVTLERVQNWSKTLEKKGIVLVPLSGLLARREPS